MHEPLHVIGVMDIAGPLVAALVFVAGMSLIPEPARRRFNAVFVAGATGVYLSGGLGLWELAYPVVALPVLYAGLGSQRWIGVAWLMHAGWDVVHHLYGNPIWPFMPTSSLGCVVFDTAIAVWFLAGAPALVGRRAVRPVGGEARTAKISSPA